MGWRECGWGIGAAIACGWRVVASLWYGEVGVVDGEEKSWESCVRLRFVMAECTEVLILWGSFITGVNPKAGPRLKSTVHDYSSRLNFLQRTT